MRLSLSNDRDLQSNVQNSTASAYEAAVSERLSSRIMDGLFDGTINGDTEKAEFYTELSENMSALIQIRNSIIRKIKDILIVSQDYSIEYNYGHNGDTSSALAAEGIASYKAENGSEV